MMQFEAIKTDRLYVRVADRISNFIESGDIKPGERLPSERDLATQLGVSRPTVREAMIALELSGIIEIKTGSGIYVSQKPPQLSVPDSGIGPFEILESRSMIEAEACAMAATRITDEQIAELRSVLQEMKLEELSENASERADRKFHCLIASAAQNSATEAIVKWLWDLRDESSLSAAFLDRIRQEGVHPSIDDHQAILEALENRDAEAAREAMRRHIHNATEAAATHFNA